MLTEKHLHDYQQACVRYIEENAHAGLLLEMGLGKTVSTLTAIKHLYDDLEISKVLVIAPKRVAETVWKDEVEKWGHLNGLKVVRIMGTAWQRKHALKQKGVIYTLGRDNVQWLFALLGREWPFDMLVVDESSSFKNHASLRFKSLKKVLDSFDRRVILTGTMAPNGLHDVWSQMYLLDKGERLGAFVTDFRNRWFTKKYSGFGYELRPGADEAIHKRIDDICISMKAEDYLNLPERIYNDVRIDLPDKVQEQYKDFERKRVMELLEYMEYLDTGGPDSIEAFTAGALTAKLLQFANGAIYDSERNVHEVHKCKLDALDEILEGLNGSPLLLGWSFRHDRDRIRKRFAKLKPRDLNTEKDIRDWNAGKIRLLMMHPASGGHGLNLQAGGHHIAWFGVPWSLELYQQMNARLDRQGQKNQVTVHRITCKRTVDDDVLSALGSKSDTQNELMKALKARIDKYR